MVTNYSQLLARKPRELNSWNTSRRTSISIDCELVCRCPRVPPQTSHGMYTFFYRRLTVLFRSQLAHFLRKSPYNVNLLVAGYEEKTGPSLYFMDYLASIHEIPRAAHGYAAHFTLGLLDRFYKKDLTEEEGIQIIRMCIQELATRFLVNRTGFIIKLVSKDGVRVIPTH